jgi:hypothetical protein
MENNDHWVTAAAVVDGDVVDVILAGSGDYDVLLEYCEYAVITALDYMFGVGKSYRMAECQEFNSGLVNCGVIALRRALLHLMHGKLEITQEMFDELGTYKDSRILFALAMYMDLWMVPVVGVPVAVASNLNDNDNDDDNESDDGKVAAREPDNLPRSNSVSNLNDTDNESECGNIAAREPDNLPRSNSASNLNDNDNESEGGDVAAHEPDNLPHSNSESENEISVVPRVGTQPIRVDSAGGDSNSDDTFERLVLAAGNKFTQLSRRPSRRRESRREPRWRVQLPGPDEAGPFRYRRVFNVDDSVAHVVPNEPGLCEAVIASLEAEEAASGDDNNEDETESEDMEEENVLVAAEERPVIDGGRRYLDTPDTLPLHQVHPYWVGASPSSSVLAFFMVVCGMLVKLLTLFEMSRT